jgi:hypothetical protein
MMLKFCHSLAPRIGADWAAGEAKNGLKTASQGELQ